MTEFLTFKERKVKKLIALSLVVLSCYCGLSYGRGLSYGNVSPEVKKCIKNHFCLNLAHKKCQQADEVIHSGDDYRLSDDCRNFLERDAAKLLASADSCVKTCEKDPLANGEW